MNGLRLMVFAAAVTAACSGCSDSTEQDTLALAPVPMCSLTAEQLDRLVEELRKRADFLGVVEELNNSQIGFRSYLPPVEDSERVLLETTGELQAGDAGVVTFACSISGSRQGGFHAVVSVKLGPNLNVLSVNVRKLHSP